MKDREGAPMSGLSWAGVIIFIVAIIVFIFAVVMLEQQKPNVQGWVWTLLIVSLIVIIVSFWMYAFGNKALPNYYNYVSHDPGWQMKYANVPGAQVTSTTVTSTTVPTTTGQGILV